jgi:hypothetical protein
MGRRPIFRINRNLRPFLWPFVAYLLTAILCLVLMRLA